MRCWAVDLDVSVLDQQLKLFVSRHSAFLSEEVRGKPVLGLTEGKRSGQTLGVDLYPGLLSQYPVDLHV